ncbi:MAG: transglutaminase [marine bacterium B5-7]|nr:MAG: transglutaminase [marine bacterium B5-7]
MSTPGGHKTHDRVESEFRPVKPRRWQFPQPPSAPLEAPTRAALATTVMTVPLALGLHVMYQPLWLGVVVMTLVAVRLITLARGLLVPGKLLRWILTLAMLVLLLTEYRTIFGRTAGSAMLIAFTALKVIETDSLRDAMFLNILTAIVVLAAFLFDQSPSTAAIGFFCLALVISNFVLLVAPGSFTIKGAMLLTSRIILHGIPLAIVAYVLFPRIEGSLWGMADDKPRAISGLSEQVAPGSISELSLNDAVAFRVEFNQDRPHHDQLYWRTLVLDRFDGRTWSRAERRHEVFPADTNPKLVAYDMTLEATDKTWLPLLETPVSVSIGNPLSNLALGETRQPIRERIRFKAASVTARYMATGPPDDHLTDLYPGINKKIIALAQDLAGDPADNPNAEMIAARALELFTQSPFRYSLQPPLLDGEPVYQFLFNTRNGYCEHYASAFATLMRAAGIPARLVVGYQGGEYNPTGDYTIVRQSNAHAWAEIWVDGRGWRRIDPTAAVAPERVEIGVDALRRGDSLAGFNSGFGTSGIRNMLRSGWLGDNLRRIRHLSDAFVYQWNNWVMAYGPQRQQQLMKRLGVATPDWPWLVMTLTAAFAVFMIATYLLLSATSRQAETPLKHYRRFKSKLARAGIRVMPSEGPLSLSKRAAEALPDHAETIETIGKTYICLRYSRSPNEMGLIGLRRAVAGFKPDRGKFR